MVSREQQTKILGVIKPAIETAFTKVMLELLQEQYPTKEFTELPTEGISLFIDEYTDLFLDYYGGNRKRRPTSMDIAKAMASRERKENEGTLAQDYLTPNLIEEFMARVSIPGVLQRHLPAGNIRI